MLTDPAPGSATVTDWERANRRRDGLYELVGGTLIRRAGSDLAAWLGGQILTAIGNAVQEGRGGYVFDARRPVAAGGDLRLPSGSYVRAADLPNGLGNDRFSKAVPALVVEVLSPGNTRAEMERKRSVYFAAGVELVWEADPLARTVVVWTGPDADTTLREGDALTGGSVLPGFSVALDDLFAGADLSDAEIS